MKFKRIYIEITNNCNLNCSFCSKTNKVKRYLSVNEFENILKKINDYTNYIYLHVKGEPLLHPDLDKILDLLDKYNKKVIITTNGTLLKERLDILLKHNIYRINISLHSENSKQNYLENILECISILKTDTIISLRFWTLDENKMDDKTKKYINVIKEYYNVLEIYNNIKLDNNIYLSLDNKFDWPSEANSNSDGYCQGGKSHIGILSDGTVVICCLDGEGESNLGNLFKCDLESILNSDKYQNIISNFKDNKCYLDICKKCTYKIRFK